MEQKFICNIHKDITIQKSDILLQWRDTKLIFTNRTVELTTIYQRHALAVDRK